MANRNCASCDELRQDASNLIVNGLGTTECNSLKNNTGLSPSSGNNDCTDLENMNDCFVGNMADEIDAYDVCDWKEFMKKFIPNLWTTLKGIICAICGLWTNIADLRKKINDLCALINANIDHPVISYGTLPNGGSSDRRGGVVGTRNGKPTITPLARSEVASDAAWEQQNVGFRYGVLETRGCTNSCLRYEWISPDLYAYRFNAEMAPEVDDLLWSVDKASVVGRMGMTDEMWAIRAANPLGWAVDWTAGNGIINLRLSVENDRLCLRYRGVIGATNADLRGAVISPPTDHSDRLYKFTC